MVQIAPEIKEIENYVKFNERFKCNVIVSSKNIDNILITNIFKNLMYRNKKYNFDKYIVSEKENELVITDKRKERDEPLILIKKLDEHQYYFFYKDERYSELIKSILKDIPSLSSSWIKSNEIESFYQEYSNEYDIIKLKNISDPYYLRKSTSKIPPEYTDAIEKTWFIPEEIEINIKTPKFHLPMIYNRLFRDDRFTETIKAHFVINFSNPGSAEVELDSNGEIKHKSGELNATEKLIDDVYRLNQEKIEFYRKVCPLIQYKEFEDSIKIPIRNEIGKEYLIELPKIEQEFKTTIMAENLLTVAKKNFEIFGITRSREGKNFECISYLNFDNSKLGISYTSNNNPIICVFPFFATPWGLVLLEKIVANNLPYGWKSKVKLK